MKFDYEVLVIGGGPAGLSAAMTLGRLSRTTLVCDDDRPRNAPSSHINNFPSRDGVHPAEWRKLVKKDLEKYRTVGFHKGTVSSVEKSGSGFVGKLASGQSVTVKRVILAYGVKDIGLPVPGYRELWGKSIFHCPYCHGFEVRGTRIGLIANGEMAMHGLPLIYDLASDLVLFTNGKSQFTDEQMGLFAKRNIRVVESKISRLDRDGESLKAVVLEDGTSVPRTSLFAAPQFPFQLKSDIGQMLGCEKTEFGFYKVSPRHETTVSGVFACGDNMAGTHTVLLASAAGVMAGSQVVFDLLGDKFKAP